MSKMSLKMKLGVGFGTLLLILAVMGVVGYRAVQLAETADETDQLLTQKDLTSDLDAAVEMQTVGVRGFLLTSREDMLKLDENGKRDFAETMDQLGKMLATGRGKQMHAEVARQYGHFCDREIALRPAGKSEEALEMVLKREVSEARSALRKGVAEFEDFRGS